jgi:hypothetical protein
LQELWRPASFSFQKAKGKRGSAKEAILDSAELGLSGPGAGVIASGAVLSEMVCEQTQADPYFAAAVVGVVGGVTAVGAALAGPVVGAEGLIRSLKSVSAAELADREADELRRHLDTNQCSPGILGRCRILSRWRQIGGGG